MGLANLSHNQSISESQRLWMALQDYLESIKNLRPLTQQGYRQRLEVFYAWCNEHEIALGKINAKAVNLFVEHVRDTHKSHHVSKPQISSHTLAGYVRVILAFLNWCIDSSDYEQFVDPNVIHRIKLPKTEKTVIAIFTKSDLQALFVATEKEFDEHLRVRDRAMLYLLIDTGIRANELVTLTIEHTHLDPGDPYIKILGKGSKWREVGLGVQTRQALETYVQSYRKVVELSDPLFLNRYHEPLTVFGLENLVRRLGKWAGVKGVRCSPHTMRHTYACNYLMQGIGDIFKLSLLMGHEDIETTRIYLRTVQSRQARQGKSVLDEIGVK